MAKYTEEQIKEQVNAAKSGKPLKQIQKEGGMNPAALKRHAKKMGVALPKRGATPKASPVKKAPVAKKKAPAMKKPAMKKAPVKKTVTKK